MLQKRGVWAQKRQAPAAAAIPAGSFAARIPTGSGKARRCEDKPHLCCFLAFRHFSYALQRQASCCPDSYWMAVTHSQHPRSQPRPTDNRHGRSIARLANFCRTWFHQPGHAELCRCNNDVVWRHGSSMYWRVSSQRGRRAKSSWPHLKNVPGHIYNNNRRGNRRLQNEIRASIKALERSIMNN